MEEKFKDILFPYDEIRPIQDDLLEEVDKAVKKGTNLIAHAPTGLGKTIASLAPIISFAKDKDLTVFFLTSRHTQHHLAIETLKHITEKFKIPCLVTDIVGKQSMCVQEHIQDLYSNEFAEFCKNAKEKHECEFYENTKKSNKLSVRAKKVVEELVRSSPNHSEKVIEVCEREKLCPYEISTELARKAKVIVCDYFYLFHPKVSEAFFKKTGKKLEESIIIVDEGHNLPARIRNLFTQKTSTFILDRAITEAKKFDFKELVPKIHEIRHLINQLSKKISSDGKETLITKEGFFNKLSEQYDYDELIAEFEFAADEIREKQRSSYIGALSAFLSGWLGPDKGFSRILSINEYKGKRNISLSYRCLDPSLSSTVVVEHSYSTILMSGTLKPTEMYADLLGFPKQRTVQKEFGSPFPKKNKLTLIVPETTTKFTQRSEEQFKNIAKICSNITNTIKGNSAIFLPSYFLLDQVNRHFSELSQKRIIREVPGLSKEGKHDMLEEFKSQSKEGAILLGVASGSFGEGVDLPGDLLKCVIVVGIPLQKPDLETNEIIAYYDKKFGHGWDYAYLYPAILTSLQNAGRCIRSEKDKGVIVFLDERYDWPNYKKILQNEDIIVTKGYLHEINKFFEK
jgi:DNA excision repair protein ERCC-2|tara:strand:- start:519 stop:2399 length:1881 start_codon:yes stop_codon:yes gene_type:complete